jgi:benzoyl-CoA 2,3-dioxygenase component A
MDMAERSQTPSSKQHLIDPEICIRCNTCEAMCPVGAITHDSRNYVVDAEQVQLVHGLHPPCPTGSIDNWRTMPRCAAYSGGGAARLGRTAGRAVARAAGRAGADGGGADAGRGRTARAAATRPKAARPTSLQQRAVRRHAAALVGRARLHQPVRPEGAEKSITATVVGNVRVTEVGTDYDTHHVMLDFGAMPFPVLEGQSSASSRRAPTPGRRTMRASTASPARATASGRATTTCR